MKKIMALILCISAFALAGEISLKTFDIKVGPYLGGEASYRTSEAGLNLQLVKPINQYIGVGVAFDVGAAITTSTDCDDYRFSELNEGIVLNISVPISKYFTLSTNFFGLLSFRDGTVYYAYPMNPQVIVNSDGERVVVLPDKDYGEHKFYTESFAFRSNLGLKIHTQSHRFGVEVYPFEFQVDDVARYAMSLNAVFRVF